MEFIHRDNTRMLRMRNCSLIIELICVSYVVRQCIAIIMIIIVIIIIAYIGWNVGHNQNNNFIFPNCVYQKPFYPMTWIYGVDCLSIKIAIICWLLLFEWCNTLRACVVIWIHIRLINSLSHIFDWYFTWEMVTMHGILIDWDAVALFIVHVTMYHRIITVLGVIRWPQLSLSISPSQLPQQYNVDNNSE